MLAPRDKQHYLLAVFRSDTVAGRVQVKPKLRAERRQHAPGGLRPLVSLTACAATAVAVPEEACQVDNAVLVTVLRHKVRTGTPRFGAQQFNGSADRLAHLHAAVCVVGEAMGRCVCGIWSSLESRCRK